MDNVAKPIFMVIEKSTPTMIINGQPTQMQTVKTHAIVCSCCNNTLMDFNGTIPLKERANYINSNMRSVIKYCPNCGSKLDYGGFEVVDAEVMDIQTNEN